MSTSGTYAFPVTRDDIIRQAMLNIRRLDPDESPTAEETTDCSRVLNMLVKQWQGKADFAPGLKVWTRKTGYLLLDGSSGSMGLGPTSRGWTNSLVVNASTADAPLGATSVQIKSVAGITVGDTVAVELDTHDLQYSTVTSAVGTTLSFSTPLTYQASNTAAIFTYTIAAQKPLVIETAWLRDANLNDTPLNFLNVQDWSYLPNKNDPTNEGDPAGIYWEDGLSTSTLYMDVGSAQDVSKYIVMKYMEPVQGFSNPLDNPYYPEEWYLPLCWGLAEQICPMFGANWTQQMEGLKTSAMLIARNKGAENSTLFFQPGNE